MAHNLLIPLTNILLAHNHLLNMRHCGNINLYDKYIKIHSEYDFNSSLKVLFINLNPLAGRHLTYQFCQKFKRNMFCFFKSNTTFSDVWFALHRFLIGFGVPIELFWFGINPHVVKIKKVLLCSKRNKGEGLLRCTMIAWRIN